MYLAAGHRLTGEVRGRAAWLWAGEATTVGGPAAAHWLGMLPAAPDIVDLTPPPATGRRSRPGVRVRHRDLDDEDRVGVRDIRVTAAPLSALETSVALPNGSTFLDRVLQRHVRLPMLQRAPSRNLGMRGPAAAGRLRAAAAGGADSVAQRLLTRLLRDAGIGGWVLGHPFGSFTVDLAFPDARVGVEVDGWAWHVDAERFRTDCRNATPWSVPDGPCCASPGTT
ncbi:hypothetical protein [Pseudonocardia sp. N23]|uniref:hypothetical protein n=1 Tax=Pseudonocardia sp. N23 TaxID=1987376 RepID=UPI000BFD084D|nr:hypothetical protein [Pseudonocardia sp. N23]